MSDIHYYDVSGSHYGITGSFGRIQGLSHNKDSYSVEYIKCPYCDYRNRFDYSRLGSVVVLKCENCGGQL